MSIPNGEHQQTVEHIEDTIHPRTDLSDAMPPVSVCRLILQSPPLWLRIAAWVGVALWSYTIWWFSSHTGPEIEEMNVFKLSDKAAHFIAFFAGAPALFLALTWSFAWPTRQTVLVCILGLALYGACDEYHQTFTPNRTGADKWDWAGDALGALAGALTCGSVYARLLRNHPPHRSAPAGD
jgi:VanZ family protein